MRGMILAAGYGTRLWPLTADRTKPAIPVLGRPLVGYVAEYLAGFGCREVVVNLHHRPDSVRAALGDGRDFGVRLHYVEEPEILGTSGAIDNARDLLDGGTFVVINGKVITDIDLEAAIETHRTCGALATLVLLRNVKRERFSIVRTSGGLVTGFGGMPDASDNAKGSRSQPDQNDYPLMFTGIQILEPRIFEFIPHGVFSHSTTDVYPQAIARNERVAAHIASGAWYELSTLERYLDINLELLGRRGLNVVTGAGSTISADAGVVDSVIWDGVEIEAGARVRGVVIGDGVRVPANAVVENSVVVRGALVKGVVPPAKASAGHYSGDNFVVPLNR